MSFNIEGKKVLITGGASGIGFCTAEIFAKNGAELILTDINQTALEQTAEKIRANTNNCVIHTYCVDVSKRHQVETMAKEVEEKLGGIDVLINNAGIGLTKEIIDTTLEEWERQIGVNLWGPLYHIYAFAPKMLEKGKGQIVNVSSGQSFFRLPTWGVYASVKQALGTTSETLFYELKNRGIKVSTVYPFMVDTNFHNAIDPVSWGAKFARKMIPYYSNKPETLGKKIYNTVVKQKKVEMVHIFNYFGFYMHFVPFLSAIIHRAVYLFLGRKYPESIDRNKLTAVVGMIKEKRLGFQLDEVMSGEHQFEPNCGPKGKKKMEFRVTWGAKHFLQWINPFGQKFMWNSLEGRVDVEGMCDSARCSGSLDLRYFSERKIRYTFEFESNGTKYLYVGEKKNIWPWNLHRSHTTCYGTLIESDSGKLISKSITYFRLSTLWEFLLSFRLA